MPPGVRTSMAEAWCAVCLAIVGGDSRRPRAGAHLQSHLEGRTCITKYNHIHYRIHRVCLDKSTLDNFDCNGGQITFKNYFWTAHNI